MFGFFWFCFVVVWFVFCFVGFVCVVFRVVLLLVFVILGVGYSFHFAVGWRGLVEMFSEGKGEDA